MAKSTIGAGLESLLAAGHVFTFDHAQEPALKFVAQVAGGITTDWKNLMSGQQAKPLRLPR